MQLDGARRTARRELNGDESKRGYLNWNKDQQFYFTPERTKDSVAWIMGDGSIAAYKW